MSNIESEGNAYEESQHHGESEVISDEETGEKDIKSGLKEGMTIEQLNEKWPNVSLRKCTAIYDVLSQVSKASGGKLPEGLSLDDDRIQTSGYLQEYADSVLKDEEFWKSLPEKIIPTEEEVADSRRMLNAISERVSKQERPDNPISADNIAQIAAITSEYSNTTPDGLLEVYKQGIDTEILKDQLRRVLDECR